MRPGGFIDRARAAALMQAWRLDALLLLQPESLRWASGADPGVAVNWRRAGAAMVLVPADPREPLAAVVGDLQAASFQAASGIEEVRTHPIWVDTAAVPRADLRGDALRAALAGPARPRPSTFDLTLALRELAEILARRGLARGRVGTEHAFLPVAEAAGFAAALPGVTWSDASPLVARLRMIKHPQEARWLALAAGAAEEGLRAVAAALRPGCDAAGLTALFGEAARAAARHLEVPEHFGTWAYIAVGPDGFTPGGPARPGDVVKVDVGCVVRGYASDGARTFVVGEPTAAAQEVHAALLSGFEAGLSALRPGVPLASVYRTALARVHEAGFTGYARGHFGHGLGASAWSEEWPFIAADAEVAAEPGMVLAFEVPWYIRGLGGFIIEDQVAVTEAGIDVAWSVPRDLISVPA